jgi:hypothetical protein
MALAGSWGEAESPPIVVHNHAGFRAIAAPFRDREAVGAQPAAFAVFGAWGDRF